MILAALPLAGCDAMRRTITGSGNLETRDFPLTNFRNVDIGSVFQFEIEQGDLFSIRITADDNLFDQFEVTKIRDTLQIQLPPRNVSLRNATLRAEVTLPDLHGLNISSATRGTVTGFVSSHRFTFDASGASRLTGDLVTGDMTIDMSGASFLELKGSCRDLTIDGSGASHLDLSDFPCSNANVDLSGASHATVNVTDRLDPIDLSGASHLSYIGNPAIGRIDTSGSSTIQQK